MACWSALTPGNVWLKVWVLPSLLYRVLHWRWWLWHNDRKGKYKLVVTQDCQIFILSSVHDNAGHHRYFAMHTHIILHYWWPFKFMGNNINWFVKTCHICQMRKTQKVLIPPIIATPAPLFTKIYVDTMHMPLSSGFKFIIQGRCSVIHWPEFEMLQ